ncbi:MAG: glycosyltransferase [bacterium]
MKILYIGCERFIQIFAAKMHQLGESADSYDLNVWKRMGIFQRLRIISACDVIHYYWGRRIRLEEILMARLLGKRIIFTFIGSDVMRVTRAAWWKRWRARLGMKMVHQVTTVAPWLRDELETIHIQSRVVFTAFIESQSETCPLPEQFTVLSYIPEDRPHFYGWKTVLRLAREMPEINFEIVGTAGKDLEKEPNIHFHGWVSPIIPYINRANVLLRLTEHDGLPWMMLEALSCARHVIWTYQFPFCQPHGRYEDTKQNLLFLKEKSSLNYGGAAYIRDNFSEEKIMNKWKDMYSKGNYIVCDHDNG